MQVSNFQTDRTSMRATQVSKRSQMKLEDSEVSQLRLISKVVVRVRPFLQHEIQQSGKKGKDLCVKTYSPMDDS